MIAERVDAEAERQRGGNEEENREHVDGAGHARECNAISRGTGARRAEAEEAPLLGTPGPRTRLTRRGRAPA